MVRVLYVMGLYRSGSTILDILLGNQPGLVGVGELRNLPLIGWDHGGACGCGSAVDDCEFWRSVRGDWERSVGAGRVERLAELQERFERLRSLPRLLVASALSGRRELAEYGELVSGLYGAIARAANSSVVVDSTKYPTRALALLQCPGIDLRIVHLVRDGRAVIWSMRRQLNTDLRGEVLEVAPERVGEHTTRQWLLTNLASELVVRRAGERAIRVRYEDLVERPAVELGRIGRLIGTDFGPLAGRVAEGAELATGHTVAGNRVRMKGRVQLRPDTEWRSKLDPRDAATFWKSAGLLARRYGYTRS